MALFKIFKGNNTDRLTNPSTTAVGGYMPLIDGYAYYDTTSRLFYIDAEYPELDKNQKFKYDENNELIVSLKRAPINANLAWSAQRDGATNPQVIDSTYIKELRYATATHSLIAKHGDDTDGAEVILPIAIASYTGGYGLVPNSTNDDKNKFLSGAGQWTAITKSTVGLDNVLNIDTTNADNITSGTFALERLPSAPDVVPSTYGTDSTSSNNNMITLSYSSSFNIPSITVDSYGRITKISNTTLKLPASDNKDNYINSIKFTNDSISSTAPLQMTLIRIGTTTAEITANIPAVSSAMPGIVPKGSAVSDQTKDTKFLREDGEWAIPSYTQMAALTFGANDAFTYDGTTAVNVPLYTGTGSWE